MPRVLVLRETTEERTAHPEALGKIIIQSFHSDTFIPCRYSGIMIIVFSDKMKKNPHPVFLIESYLQCSLQGLWKLTQACLSSKEINQGRAA